MILAFQMVQKPGDLPAAIAIVVVFVYGILPIASVIGGIILDRMVARVVPIVNPISAAALIAVMVSAAILLVLIGPQFPNSVDGFFAALLVTTLVPLGVVLVIAFLFWQRQRVYAGRMRREDEFAVFGDDRRGRTKNLRRR